MTGFVSCRSVVDCEWVDDTGRSVDKGVFGVGHIRFRIVSFESGTSLTSIKSEASVLTDDESGADRFAGGALRTRTVGDDNTSSHWTSSCET